MVRLLRNHRIRCHQFVDNPPDLPNFLTESVNHFTLGGRTIGSSGDFGGIGW
jgi:hypothetical protein